MMGQRIHLAAIVASQGRLLLVRDDRGAPWELPGGPLLPEHDDVDAAMDAHLERFGISAPAIEEDFVETIHLPGDGGPTIYNLYAASAWRGAPVAPPGATIDWVGLYELDAITMDATVRDAVLAAFGLKERIEPTERILAEIQGVVFGEQTPSRQSPPRGAPHLPRPASIEAYLRGEVDAEAAIDGPTRHLIVIALLAAQGRIDALPAHIESALKAGASLAALAGTLELVKAYAGVAAAAEAWKVLARFPAGSKPGCAEETT